MESSKEMNMNEFIEKFIKREVQLHVDDLGLLGKANSMMQLSNFNPILRSKQYVFVSSGLFGITKHLSTSDYMNPRRNGMPVIPLTYIKFPNHEK